MLAFDEIRVMPEMSDHSSSSELKNTGNLISHLSLQTLKGQFKTHFQFLDTFSNSQFPLRLVGSLLGAKELIRWGLGLHFGIYVA